MIDKLDLRILNGSPFRPDVRDYIRGLPYQTYTARVRPAVHYAGKADLRPIGFDAILHVQCKHGEHAHKLELLNVGEKTYSEVIQMVEGITDADPLSLGIMRIDLTADVKDVTVPWFKNHLRFKFKRTDNEHGQLRYGLIGHGEVETILAGSRPNVFRIYNKTRELHHQFQGMQRKASKDAEPLDFEREFGLKESDIRTRVERQCGGSRIPTPLATFGSLHNAPDFNPFESLEIIASGYTTLPAPKDCQGLEYYTGIGLHAEAQRVGMQEFRKNLNKQTKANAARILERYRRFFPDGAGPVITVQQIYETYRKSVIDQLAA